MNATMFRAICLAILCAVTGAQAGEPWASLAELIDLHIAEHLEQEGLSSAQPLDDAGFLRRVMLDLAGRIPTSQEWTDFAAWDAADKRNRLIDRLLDSPDFAFHLRNELDILLLARKTQNDPWREYLLAACREDRHWDQLFREILLPEYERPDELGPAAYIRERVRDLDDLTNDTSSLWFGVNIGCAKCHDHPLVADWEQQHYFGMARFFKQTYRTKQGFLAERPVGNMKFTDILGHEQQAEFMFLTGTKVDAPQQTLSQEELKQIDELIRKAEREDNAERPPLPEFSSRKQLVALALNPSGSDFFARNIVNRTWARLIGYGLVHPLDQLHSQNPASHPQLLDALTNDFVQHGYDLKRLIGSIVCSETYACASRLSDADRRPPVDLFAVAVPRPLTPRQLSLSLIIASGNPDKLPGLEKPSDWEQQRGRWESQADGLARRLEIPDDGFQVGADEALFFSNAAQFEADYLRDSDDRLVATLKSVKEPEHLIQTAFAATLTRQPSDEERQAINRYLDARKDRKTDALRQVLWALLASPEFRFNH